MIKLYQNGEWTPWGGRGSPRVINMYLDLLKLLHPGVPVAVSAYDG